MKVLRDESSIRVFLSKKPIGESESEMQSLVEEQVQSLTKLGYPDPADVLHVVEMEKGDKTVDLEDFLGMLLLKNRWTGIEAGADGFAPSWESVERYEHWYLMVVVMSDDGFGYFVFVPRNHQSELPGLFDPYLE